MLESFSAVVYHSLRSGRSTLSHILPLASTIDSLSSRPTRSVIQMDFFTSQHHPSSHSRRPRGRERIRGREHQQQQVAHAAGHWDTQCVSQCTDWLCVLNQSFWMSRRSRMLMMKEFLPLRGGSSRRKTSASTSGPRLRVARNRLFAPFHSSWSTRHSSSSSQAVASTSQQPNLIQSQDLLRRIVSADDLKFDLDEALAALEHVAHRGRLESFSSAETSTLLNRIISAAEKGYASLDSDVLHDRGHRLHTFVEGLDTDVSPLSLEDLRRTCLLARCMALTGELQEATTLLRKCEDMPMVYEERGVVVQVYEGILLSTRRYYGEDHALDLMLAEWENIGSFLSLRPSKWHHSEPRIQGTSLRNSAYTLLASIDHPETLLVSRKTWELDRRRRLGHLLIEALCSRNLAEDAHSVYQEMCKQAIPVERGLQLSLVRTLARSDLFGLANALYHSIDSTRAHKHHLSTGLYLYAHQGDSERAEYYYELLSRRDGWITEPDTAMLIYSHATQGRVEGALSVFDRFFPIQEDGKREPAPRSIHYTIIIYAYAHNGDFTAMNQWLEKMAEGGFPPDIYVYSIILRSFAMRGDIDSIAAVLDQMRAAGVPPTAVPYTTTITLLAHRKDPVAAETLYKRAVQEGVVPDRRMVNTIMDAHVEAGSWNGVVRVFDYLRNSRMQHVRLSIESYNTLLKAYILIGAPFRVVSKLFGRLEATKVQPNARTFTLLVQSACDSGLMDIASEIVEEMDRLSQQPNSDIGVDVHVLTIIMSGYLRLGNKVKAKEIYDEMQTRGIQPSAITFGTILNSYGHDKSEDSLKIAEEFLASLMSAENSPQKWTPPTHGGKSALALVYGPLITSYARRQRPEDVERLFQGYLDAGGEPTIGILATLLNVYRRTFNIEAVQQVWPQIFQLGLRYTRMDALFKDMPKDRQRSRLQANILCIPLSMYVDALSAAGLHKEIAQVWTRFQAHGFSFDSHNWNHLAVALIRAGEPERAFEVLERVILPFQRQTTHLLSMRNEAPDSPLSFDKVPTQEDLQATPSQGSPMHNSGRRAFIAKTVFKHVRHSSEEGHDIFDAEPADFAHPLRVLHQISPSWNIWAPHTATLNVLLMVLLRLQEGALVEPVQPEPDQATQTKPQQDATTRREVARDMLHRIYKNYPKAVRVVLDHELKERRRLGSDYDQTYNWR